jgi:hypothetical protein
MNPKSHDLSTKFVLRIFFNFFNKFFLNGCKVHKLHGPKKSYLVDSFLHRYFPSMIHGNSTCENERINGRKVTPQKKKKPIIKKNYIEHKV